MGDLRNRQAVFGLVIVAAGLTIGGCDDEGSDTGMPSAARFSVLQEEVFTPRCSLASCHSSTFHAGDLVLEPEHSYGQLTSGDVDNAAAAMEGLARVVPGDAASSFLWIKLQPGLDAKYGMLMPQGSQDGLPEADLAAIEQWIENGARNN